MAGVAWVARVARVARGGLKIYSNQFQVEASPSVVPQLINTKWLSQQREE